MSEKIKELFCRPVYERMLLAYCVKSMDYYYSIVSMVREEDFLRPEHKLIFVIIGTLIKRGVSAISSALIISEARDNNLLDRVGGFTYINAIFDMEIEEENIEFCIKKALDASTKYKLHVKLGKHTRNLEKNGQNEDISSYDLMAKAEADLMSLSMDSKFVKEPKNLSDGLKEYNEERKNNPVEYCGISTGFPIVDKLIDGLVPGTLTVICARPKQGKSTLLSCIGSYTAYDTRKPVLYIDTEMPFDQWRTRILSMMSGVEERKIKHGGYSDMDYQRLQKAEKLVDSGKFFHEFLPGYDVDKVVSLYKKYKYKEDIGLAVFDYIKAPQGSDFQNKKEYQIIGDVTTALKDLSGELDIPFLAANQINRQEDIADSDRVLRYADVIAFFKRMSDEEIEDIKQKYRPFENDYGTHKLVIRDSRRGGQTPEEGIGFSFKKRFLTIEEAKLQRIDYNSAEYAKIEVDNYEYSDADDTDDSYDTENNSDTTNF